MTRQTSSQTIYVDRDVDFDAILTMDALGGVFGLNNYLHTRSRQLTRKLSQTGLTVEDRNRLAAIAEAVEEARQLLPLLLAQPATSTEGHPEAMRK